MSGLKNDFKKYVDFGIIPFSANISKKMNKKGEYKKEIDWCNWKNSTLQKPIYNTKYNSLGLKTGQESNIFVLDIDDVNEWKKILEDEEREEPNTATVITGSEGLHYYFKYTEDLKDIPSRTKIIGEKIDSRSNGGCIFAPPSSYFNEETQKTVYYRWKEGKSIFDYEQLPQVPKWLLKLMLKTIEKETEPKQQIKQIKNIKPTDLLNVELEQTKIKLNEEQINELMDLLDPKRADNYTSWINVLFCLKCENNNDNLKYFIEFSKRSKEYNKDSVLEYWNKYDANKNNNKLTYNTLLFYVKNDNPIKYNEFVKKHLIKEMEDEQEIIIKDTLKINQNYLLINKVLENDNVGCFINNYLESDDKVLFIKSPYDTGKTTFLKTITPKFERILFVSYRITLSENLLGNFKDFEIYYNSFCEDKIICQIDSLDKLSYNRYDLIIIDECESVLNHFSAGSLKNQNKAFEVFCSFLINSKKIICLDGDLANRSKKILSVFGKSKMIVNDIKKDPNHFILTANEEYFNSDIDKAIKDNKNIVIVSMSDTKAKNIYNKYKNDYRTILYTSSTSDSDKKFLAQVEKIWTQHQIIIYSPSIESGVDFNVEDYIDNIYIVMCSNSTSQRGLNQMVKRCRKLNNNNILVYTNSLYLQDKTVLKYYYYTIPEIKAYYSNLIGEKVDFEINNDGELIKTNNNIHYDLYDILTLYNKQEQMNKNCNCFIPLFLKMIEEKGNTYEITDGKRKKEKSENILYKILEETKQITEQDYNKLLLKQTKRNLEEDEKNQIKKYIYEQTFGVNFDNEEIIKKYYGKLNIIKNAYQLFNDNNKFNTNKILNNEKEEKIKIAKNILKMFKIIDIKDINYTLNNQDLKDNIEGFNKIVQDNKILLGLSKSIKIETTQGLLGSLRTILSSYGIEIIMKQKQEKKGANKVNYYILELDGNVKEKINTVLFKNFMNDFNF